MGTHQVYNSSPEARSRGRYTLLHKRENNELKGSRKVAIETRGTRRDRKDVGRKSTGNVRTTSILHHVRNYLTLYQFRFRWAACQLDTLRDCLNYRAVLETLNSLPATLDETCSNYSQFTLCTQRRHNPMSTILGLLRQAPASRGTC